MLKNNGVWLQADKGLIVPTPKLRSGLFNLIKPPADGGVNAIKACATRQVGFIIKDYSDTLPDKNPF